MLWRLAPDSPEPLYLQLVRQLRAAVASGRMQPGERIPSHRELAAQLVINHLTIKRAFDLLEAEGLVITKRGLGTFVADRLPAGHAAVGRDEVSADLVRAAQAARRLALTREQWNALNDRAWRASASPEDT
ncbi:MAG: GntR family transcriptional regulator [Planctomycetes bacterium]|nr:GntR family transcriptional regulator [Planctomycetota bacterium]